MLAGSRMSVVGIVVAVVVIKRRGGTFPIERYRRGTEFAETSPA